MTIDSSIETAVEAASADAPAVATKPPEKPAEPAAEAEPAEDGALRNKRPTGKASHRLRRRNRGGVATDE